ncbi:CheR family methyltransferase [Alicyclobacillus macrosporangiidus]|jgi:chemotaxis protein methyltransferase CheR|uniref:protein-glutamate O-methyltransferase n=1 Tax=Alicyclobacillus macrosporangiidus TaxID=392015 RepID=A0A1I7L7C4_9BACL|nr:protein-glutamate O-methyltransferase CheR [Alicyclobacillus macrosporangiidus]SFV05629.1 chemotaxis protein methyltransferase CheR [Alicyclobacillus macrosporangiidus]
MDEFLQFARQLERLTGIDLTLYKRPQMERRLTALREKRGYRRFQDYFRALEEQPEILNELLDKMTINVSEFLRNPERWQALMQHLPEVAGRPLKAWSAACASGEEPYTLALLLEERGGVRYDILATDIDRAVLARAEQGYYKEHQVRSLPPAWLERYFRRDGDAYAVSSRLRRHVRFLQHNLLADPYPGPLDLIICRNVLIYFTDEAKRRVIEGFSASLAPGGILFVGSTEQFIGAERFGFSSVGPFLYRKRD